LYIRPRKHITDTNYIVKIKWTKFYQQPHKYFNLIIFNEILIIQKLRNFSEAQVKLPKDETDVSKHAGMFII